MSLTTQDLIDNIAEVLAGADGHYIAETYNKICSDQVVYKGDSQFARVTTEADQSK